VLDYRRYAPVPAPGRSRPCILRCGSG
jgi:hypothetical protein